MILQTDKNFPKKINDFGCYMMSIMFLAGELTNTPLTIENVLETYEQGIKKKLLDEECFILNPDALFNYLGVKTQYTQRHEPPTYEATDKQLEIQVWHWKFSHFVAAQGGVIAYDPLGKSYSVKNGQLRSKRIFNLCD